MKVVATKPEQKKAKTGLTSKILLTSTLAPNLLQTKAQNHSWIKRLTIITMLLNLVSKQGQKIGIHH